MSGHLGDKLWATVDWATKQPGDSQLGDNFWTTGRHQLGHLGDKI